MLLAHEAMTLSAPIIHFFIGGSGTHDATATLGRLRDGFSFENRWTGVTTVRHCFFHSGRQAATLSTPQKWFRQRVTKIEKEVVTLVRSFVLEMVVFQYVRVDRRDIQEIEEQFIRPTLAFSLATEEPNHVIKVVDTRFCGVIGDDQVRLSVNDSSNAMFGRQKEYVSSAFILV